MTPDDLRPPETDDAEARRDPPQNTPEPGSDLAVVVWMAQRFGLPFSADAVMARLPSQLNLSDPHPLARALGAIGLKTRLLQRDIRSIDPAVLPVLVWRKSGAPVVVQAVAQGGKLAQIIDPSQSPLVQEVPLKELRRDLQPEVMLVTRDADHARRMMAPDSAPAPDRGSWFWGPVRANWGSWMQILVAALLLNVMSLALPLFVMNVYDKVIPNLAYVTLWTLAIGVGIALALDFVMRILRANILENIGRRVDMTVAASLFRQAMNAQLLSRPGGAAGIASTIRDFEVVREFFASASFVAVIDMLFIGIFVAALFWVVGPVALVPLLAVPVVLLLAVIAQLPLGRSAADAQRMATKRHVVLVEALGGVETIKSVGAEPVMQREWEAAVAASSQINGRTRFWSNVATTGTALIQQMVSVLIIVWGVFLVAEGQISIGALIAANILAGRVLAPLGAIAQTIFRAQYAVKSLAALNRFMALPVEQETVLRGNARVSAGAVRLEEVTFSYPEAQRPALKDLSFSVDAGASVALLGRVGSGKTTTGKLLAGLITPDSGNVLVDGVALSQYDPAELRRGIGYLPQTPELFTGTLRENLTLGQPDARDAEIAQALYFAAMDEFMAEAPDGLDMFIGEQGQRLSGGQKQGVALARLLLRKPKTLFLDEPTNAMDQRMQGQIIERFQELNATGVGLIVCTHRQSLAAMADRLIVMDQGRAVLDGPRSEVLDKLRAMGAARGGA
ncbi:peptide ABC transporter ATP-binding protein [Roseobacter cerasinus]|uniref:Peptide ABC transporter ATP-binding protein n=1 Tax=Roseobacter cerasinus TaxID=2602289 RepID=A0A640VQX1_9RHOB|nr:type I secretion system permease/ATPase [Roseobacter cerasinus]GFE50004.1 peptide ABC transporter ATP-binding protein [Roseobacter cerasinus]